MAPHKERFISGAAPCILPPPPCAERSAARGRGAGRGRAAESSPRRPESLCACAAGRGGAWPARGVASRRRSSGNQRNPARAAAAGRVERGRGRRRFEAVVTGALAATPLNHRWAPPHFTARTSVLLPFLLCPCNPVREPGAQPPFLPTPGGRGLPRVSADI